MISAKTFEHYTDAQVIEKILAGEDQLYELLIRRNNPYLYRVGRSYNYNHHDTEDLMQETYINAFYNLGKFEGKSSFKRGSRASCSISATRKNKNTASRKKNPPRYKQKYKVPCSRIK